MVWAATLPNTLLQFCGAHHSIPYLHQNCYYVWVPGRLFFFATQLNFYFYYFFASINCQLAKNLALNDTESAELNFVKPISFWKDIFCMTTVIIALASSWQALKQKIIVWAKAPLLPTSKDPFLILLHLWYKLSSMVLTISISVIHQSTHRSCSQSKWTWYQQWKWLGATRGWSSWHRHRRWCNWLCGSWSRNWPYSWSCSSSLKQWSFHWWDLELDRVYEGDFE